MSRCVVAARNVSCSGCSTAEQHRANHHLFLHSSPPSTMPTAMQPTISDNSHNVFVYGTLKRGQDNHNCLGGSTYLGACRS